MTALTAWAIYLVGACGVAFFVGFFDTDDDVCAPLVVFWPLWLVCGAVALPFVGIYRIGLWLRERVSR